MKKVFFLILLLVIAPTTYATVSTRVCRADGNTLLELADPGIPFVYRPIMAGTHLTIIISSDTIDDWYGGLALWDANQDYGRLYGRDFNWETLDYEGSHFPAAGDMAAVMGWKGYLTVDGQEHDVNGLQFSRGYENFVPGDWFIVDYNAISAGACSISFNDFTIPEWDHPVYQISFTQVKTRDFDDDGRVNFKDLALLGSNWHRTDCSESENCLGTDLDEDGKVDLIDLQLFADFWLETTR